MTLMHAYAHISKGHA